ncbi:MAG: histidine kinase [Ruminiclostridium sp.]|nr:histidine kinase [Ruminiclostridium sp.]
MESIRLNKHFIEDIIDGMFDWVRVLDKDDNVIYMNKAMSDGMKDAKTGSKCYNAIGRSTPCENCISRKAVFYGNSHEKEEFINNRIYSVMSSPVKNEKGEIIAVVEVLRDTTQVKQLQEKILRQNAVLRDDLSMARRLQCSLLPKDFSEARAGFSYIYNTCEALGGDFLDIFKIGEKHLGLYVADVSGHGVPASMLTVFLRSTLNKKLYSPSAALNELFKEFNNSNFGDDLYITIFYTIIDLEEKTMIYSNAGHNVSPFIFRSANENSFELLRHPGIPISRWVESPGYKDGFTKLTPGDRLFFYTDGIIEMRNTENEQFGEDRLLKLLLAGNREPVETLNDIFTAACEFAGLNDTTKIPDDVTMAFLEIRLNPDGSSRPSDFW